MSARSWNKGMVTIWSLIAIVAVLLLTLVFWPQSSKADNGNDTAPKEIAAGLGPQRAPDDCVDKYNVVLDENKKNNLISDGTLDMSDQEVVRKFLDVAQHDPRVLQIGYNASPLGKDKPITDWRSLVDNGCYTAEARDLYQQMRGVYLASKVERSAAPTDGVNTGVNPGGDGFQQRGVSGDDRDSTLVTFPNGDQVHIMHRCGNIVTPGSPIPGVPEKPQDQPPATQPPGQPDKPVGTPPPSQPPVTPKDPSKDVNVNPAVPEPVRGPGTTPVGTDPGPAQPVYDTPTGCNGPCPGGGSPSTAPAPRPTANQPAPEPTSGGRDSGSSDGSGTPGGSTCDNSGCSGGGPQPAESGPPPSADDSTHSGDPGGF